MATYDELATIAETSGSTLQKRIRVAGQMMAGAIVAEPNTTTKHAERLAWARAAFADPDGTARALVWPILYVNQTATKAQLEGASDALILAAVTTVVTALAV